MPIQHGSTAYLPKQIRRALLRALQKVAGADLALPIRALRANRGPIRLRAHPIRAVRATLIPFTRVRSTCAPLARVRTVRTPLARVRTVRMSPQNTKGAPRKVTFHSQDAPLLIYVAFSCARPQLAASSA